MRKFQQDIAFSFLVVDSDNPDDALPHFILFRCSCEVYFTNLDIL